MRRAAGALAALAAAVLLAACGSSGSPAEVGEAQDREEVEATTERFVVAVENQDAKAFCAVLAPNDKARLSGGRGDGEKRCLLVWGRGSNPLFAAADPDLSFDQIAKLEPPTAVVRLGGGGRLVLAQENGEWYVSLAPQGKEPR